MISHAGSRTVEAIGAQIKQDLGKIGMQVDFVMTGALGEKLHNSLDWECYFGAFTGGVKAQRMTQEYLPYIYLVNPLSMAAIRNNIESVRFSGLGGLLWNIYEIKIVPEISEAEPPRMRYQIQSVSENQMLLRMN